MGDDKQNKKGDSSQKKGKAPRAPKVKTGGKVIKRNDEPDDKSRIRED